MTLRGEDFSLARLENFYSLAEENETDVFWRHDVDVSLDAALKFANFEHERGISATYYLFFDGSNPFYTNQEARDLQHVLMPLGHDVGEHVDERYVQGVSDWASLVGEQVSFHCPTGDVLWRDFSWFTSACELRWKGRYASDSGGRFRTDPEELIKYANRFFRFMRQPNTPVQLNLHPERWFDPLHELKISPEVYERFFHVPHPFYKDWQEMRELGETIIKESAWVR